jgi:DNA-directed RNA polymerase subunit F
MSDKKYTFEVLCLDSTGTSVIKSEQNLTYSLLANGNLWLEPQLKNNTIIDSRLNISLGVKLINKANETDINLKDTFLIKVKGEFETLEDFRIKLISYLNNQKYNSVYIILDDISAEISCKIYPKINQVENLLRKYVIKFFVTKLGQSWWNVTADSEMKKKVIARKNNENFFSQFIDNKVYLIDFSELGKIVHSQSSGFISREDIVSKVLSLEETPNAIQNLKKELESNYTKFFKDTFKDKDFQQKWEELEKLRHKVAHNNLFTKLDHERSDKLTKELIDIINEANSKIESINFSLDEKDIIKESIVSGLMTFNVIEENELLMKLEESERWALRSRDNFVGLKHFVTNYLGSQGYDYKSSYELINQLEAKGLIEVYEFQGPINDFPVTAIKRINKVS